MLLIMIKAHALFAVLSFATVLVRNYLALQNKPHLANHKVAQLTTLALMALVLSSAFVLCIATGQYPIFDGWLSEKFILLIVYVALAVSSLSNKLSIANRTMLLTLCGAVFAMMFTIAKHHTALFLK